MWWLHLLTGPLHQTGCRRRLTARVKKIILSLYYLDNLTSFAYFNDMKTLPVGEFKAKFSKVISDVKSGEKIIVTYGKKKENIAVIIPYKEFMQKNIIDLGLLSSKKMKIREDFEMTEEEVLNS